MITDNQLSELENIILGCVNKETPEIDCFNNLVGVTAYIWIPDIYSLFSIEEIGLVFHGTLDDGTYIFRSKE